MEQALLTPAQKAVMHAVAEEPRLRQFYLSGGTALAAYYLQHRVSDDLDFFSEFEFDKIFLHAFIEKLKGIVHADTVRFERLNDRNQFFLALPAEELKVEFTLYPFHQIEESVLYDGIAVDGMRDIAANKLITLIDRFDPKDFADMFFLLQKYAIDDMRADVEKKFGIQISDIMLGQEFAKVRRVEALPRMMRQLTVEELKSFFTAEAKKLEKNIIQ